ncbi:MAG: AzlD domain-containing protein [Anaerolineae bacterium]|nr:AzlD domain-containing protein [Anaerolineae bacterium]
MNEVVLIGGMALVTFAVRYPVLALLGKIPMPEPIFRALKYVPPAVLTAIILPLIILNKEKGNILDLSFTNHYLIAGIVAGLVAWRSKNLLLTIILGMLALWGWRWLMAAVGL